MKSTGKLHSISSSAALLDPLFGVFTLTFALLYVNVLANDFNYSLCPFIVCCDVPVGCHRLLGPVNHSCESRKSGPTVTKFQRWLSHEQL